jgi:hypothetical protein
MAAENGLARSGCRLSKFSQFGLWARLAATDGAHTSTKADTASSRRAPKVHSDFQCRLVSSPGEDQPFARSM